MSARWFVCPDDEKVEINVCLNAGGCRMDNRCTTVPFLRSTIGRMFRGITPSCAGNGIRYLYLKATTDYAVNPQSMVWAIMGTGLHDKLSIHRYTANVFSEEKLSDKDITGIVDVVEEDENEKGKYILTDYKTWGSYKLAKSLGLVQKDIPVVKNGEPVLLKSGKNKGEPKTKKETVFVPSIVDLASEELQLNAYRMLFENCGFPVSRLRIQAIPRDGNTYIAKSRGIDKNIYLIPIRRVPDDEVKNFYAGMRLDYKVAMKTGFSRKCNKWESWDGRRCDGYCEVADACKNMEGGNYESTRNPIQAESEEGTI